jgi:hypothetical protein
MKLLMSINDVTAVLLLYQYSTFKMYRLQHDHEKESHDHQEGISASQIHVCEARVSSFSS